MVMADDGDRDRGRRRRRRGGRKEFERDIIMPPLMPSKPPTILAKPSGDKPRVLTNDHVDLANGPEPVPMNRVPPDKAPVLLKLRDDNHRHQPLNGSVPNLPGLLSGEAGSPQVYAIQRPAPGRTSHDAGSMGPAAAGEGSSQSRLALPPEMSRSIKLVDEFFNWSESGMEMLLDQTDFLVVGVLGMQGVGKSTILSHLAGADIEESTRLIFKSQSADARDVCSHQTIGIDMYVTSERIIYLDSQPLMSASVLHHLIQHDKKYPADYSTAENCIEMQSLQIAAFLLTVCNVVLVVSDWFVDTTLVRCLLAAEMLKPPTPMIDNSTPEEIYPHVVLVLNQAERDDFSTETYSAMQKTMERMMDKSKLKFRGAFTMASTRDVPALTKRTVQHDTNVYLIPGQASNTHMEQGIHSLLPGYQGHPGFESLIGSLRKQLLAVPRHLLTHTTLSEKNWFHYAGRTWDSIKKSQMFSEYNRLLP